ncbi:hypothetical protein SAMN02910406_00053 [Ruminococcus albus]|uniref:Uncharacterized protein n=1 Tax=Ruminococcus albus TaxID=1264 RepID=A0A1I1CZP4_RUMAL|nr:hypothetical protein SAMN02910406_00053 [Ruminococcus albus]
MQAGILNVIFYTLFLAPPEASIEDAVYRGHGTFPNRSILAIWVLREPGALNTLPLLREYIITAMKMKRAIL